MYYKHITGDYISGVVKSQNALNNEDFIAISKEEYNQLLQVIASKPADPVEEVTANEGIAVASLTAEQTEQTSTRQLYKLNKDTLSYELVTEDGSADIIADSEKG